MYLIFYTDRLPAGVAGCAWGFLIFIRPVYRADAGIHAHEVIHIEQFWRAGIVCLMLIGGIAHACGWPLWLCLTGLAAHQLLYRFVHDYRLWAEVTAYREQLRHYPDDRSEMFAGFIAERYRLAVSRAEAAKILKG